MADQDFTEFYDRVARIEKARAKGYGFEADGTLGRSHYHRPVRRKRRLVAPFVMLLACFLCLKAALHYQIGNDIYGLRVESMRSSDSGMERVAGMLMQADPLTVWLSNQFQQQLH